MICPLGKQQRDETQTQYRDLDQEERLYIAVQLQERVVSKEVEDREAVELIGGDDRRNPPIVLEPARLREVRSKEIHCAKEDERGAKEHIAHSPMQQLRDQIEKTVHEEQKLRNPRVHQKPGLRQCGLSAFVRASDRRKHGEVRLEPRQHEDGQPVKPVHTREDPDADRLELHCSTRAVAVYHRDHCNQPANEQRTKREVGYDHVQVVDALGPAHHGFFKDENPVVLGVQDRHGGVPQGIIGCT